HPDILTLQPHPLSVRVKPVVEDRSVNPAFVASMTPPGSLLIKGAVPVIGVPIVADVEINDRIAEPRRVITKRVVIALIKSGEINRPHPSAAVLEDNIAPGVVP